MPGMKVFANIVLVTIYAISSFGIGIKQFYCCGKLKSTSISYVQKETGGKCGMGKCKRNCCKHKYHFFKLDDKHVASNVLNVPEKQSCEINIHFPVEQFSWIGHQPSVTSYNSHAPPLHNGLPVYILNCVYRI